MKDANSHQYFDNNQKMMPLQGIMKQKYINFTASYVLK